MPRPGHPSGARFVLGLTVAAVAVTICGGSMIFWAVFAGRVAMVVVGIAEIICGSSLFITARGMANTERALTAQRKRREATWRARRIADLERELGVGPCNKENPCR